MWGKHIFHNTYMLEKLLPPDGVRYIAGMNCTNQVHEVIEFLKEFS